MAATKLERIRWSVEQAAAEFGRDYKAVKKNLIALDIHPGDDGKFSTPDIARAVFGDIDAERLRKTKEEADRIALENEKLRGELVEVAMVKQLGETIFVGLRQKILASSMTDQEKDELLTDMSSLKVRDWTKP
jgi:hypothetical protein